MTEATPDVFHDEDAYRLLNAWLGDGWSIVPPRRSGEVSVHPRCSWCGETGGRIALVLARGDVRRWLAFCQTCRHAAWMEL